MSSAVQRGGAQARSGQSTARIASVATIFCLLLASAWLFGYGYVSRAKPIPADQYYGFAELTLGEKGQCERFEFDNRTGLIRPQGSRKCNSNTVPSQPTNPVGPLGGVRNYFRSH